MRCSTIKAVLIMFQNLEHTILNHKKQHNTGKMMNNKITKINNIHKTKTMDAYGAIRKGSHHSVPHKHYTWDTYDLHFSANH